MNDFVVGNHHLVLYNVGALKIISPLCCALISGRGVVF